MLRMRFGEGKMALVPTMHNTSGMIGATVVCMLSACGSTKSELGADSSVSGGAQSGGSTGAGGTSSGTGGAIDASGCVGSGGAGGTGVDGGEAASFVITSAEGSYWQQAQLTEATGGGTDVTVNDCVQAQTWEGFGGCFTELGWTYLSTLSQADRDQAIHLLFGSDGARFAWGRIPIGGNDYVLSRHTLDDTGDDVIPDSTESNRPPADLSLSKFSIDGDNQSIIPYIKAAQAVKPDLRFWAVPWSPPVWMKTGYATEARNGAPAKRPSYYDGGSMKSDDATLQAHAQYFVNFVQAYKNHGINVEMVASQNEPAGGHTYPSCMWDTTAYTKFIGHYLGPALSGSGLSTKVMIGGSFDASGDTAFLSAVLADSTATGYCAVVGVGYSMVDASRVSPAKAAGLRVWVSEHQAGNYPWETATYQTTAPNGMAYAIQSWGLIRDAITKVGVTAYSAWHMVLNKVGTNIDTSIPWAQDALLVADSGQLTMTPAYYVFRHFSQFVDPGAKVVGASGGDAVAFKNPDGGLVVVLYNSGSTKTMTVAIGGKKLQFSAPGGGFATLVKP
jgi:glucosylceramidase